MIPALLLDSAPTLFSDLMSHPASIVVLIGVLWALLGITFKALLRSTEGRIEDKFATVHEKVEGLETGQADLGRKMDDMRNEASAATLVNVQAHAALSERLAKAEAKLPNGALTDVLKALALALERQPTAQAPPRVVRSPRRRSTTV